MASCGQATISTRLLREPTSLALIATRMRDLLLRGPERRCRKLLNRRSARAADCPSVTVGYPGSLTGRARSGHGVDPQKMTAAPCMGWPASGPGRLAPGAWFLTGGGGSGRARVAVGHFRRKREAPLMVEGTSGHGAGHLGPGPDHGSAPSRRLRRRGPGGHCQSGQLR